MSETTRTVSGGAILGIAFGLMALAGLVAFLVFAKSGPIDGAAALESAFGTRALPPGFRIVEANVMPGGERLIILENASSEPEPEIAQVATSAPALVKFDWAKIPLGASGNAPRRVTILLLPPDAARSRVDLFFQDVSWRDISDLPPEGGLVAVGSGKMAWRGFDASWVHERAFEPGGTLRDAMRADVSLEGKPGVLTAFWTRGEQGSQAALEALLQSFGSK